MLIEGNDRIGSLVAEAAQPLEKVNPHLAEVRKFGRVTLEYVAVVAYPLALEQVDLAFLGIDAVLGKNQRRAARLVNERTEEAGVARRNGVQYPDFGQAVGNPGQLPERRVHDAHGPEKIDEGRIGAEIAVAVADDFPRALAVQEVVQRQLASGHHGMGDFLESLHGFGHGHAGGKLVVHAGGGFEGLFIAAAGAWLFVGRLALVEEVLFEVHDVGRQFVLEGAVILTTAAKENQGETVFRVGTDDLVDPARYAAADIREGAFEEQRDIGVLGCREAHRGFQYSIAGCRRGSEAQLARSPIRRLASA